MSKPAKKILVLPDAHYPHHDPDAMACIAAVVEHLDPDEVIVLGDWLDAGGFSRHGPHSFADGAHDFLESEVGPCNEMLDTLQGAKDRKLIYLEGNHEERVNRWLVSNAGKVGPSLAKLSSPDRLLRWRVDGDGVPGVRRKNFGWVPYLGKDVHSHHRIAPDLVAIHGWSFAVGFNHVNRHSAPSTSIVCGHVHRADALNTRDAITGQRRRYWCPGALCKLVPLYQANSPSTWTHGFSLIYQSRRAARHWTAYDIAIDRGCCVLPDGTEIK
tara:strand:- start:1051 stop:1863 length:813 start_codon:yes stop_codon:yes gene_type:complete